MSLHPFFAEKFSSQAEEDPVKLPPEKLRHYIDKALIQMFGDDAWESEADVEIQDELFPTDFGNTRVRFYLPKTDNKEKLPLYLHLHGGGWWLGNVESLDPFCMELASAASCVIASVEYSLSPEATFPEAPEEVYSVLESLAAGKSQHKFDVSRIGIGGNSASLRLKVH